LNPGSLKRAWDGHSIPSRRTTQKKDAGARRKWGWLKLVSPNGGVVVGHYMSREPLGFLTLGGYECGKHRGEGVLRGTSSRNGRGGGKGHRRGNR